MANTLNLGNGNWATKEGSLLAYNDENNNYKPLPFDFTRASSATVVNKKGLIETVGSGEPRIDFSDDANGALLLEPQETQLISYSNDFSNSDWQKYGVNLYYNSAIGVDGTLSATTLSRAAGTTNRINQNKLLVAGNQYTISIYAKADSDKYITIGLIYGSLNYAATQFDLVNGIVLNSYSAGAFSVHSPKIEKMPNNWYRVSATVLPGINDSYPAFIASNTLWTSGNPGVFDPGNGVSGIYIQKPMFTNSTVLTSYIENTSVGTVTRSADTASDAGNSTVINSTEGVLYADMDFLTFSGQDYFGLNDGSNSQRVLIEKNGNTLTSYINSVSLSTTISSLSNKIAVKYKLNDFALFINGVKVATSFSGTTPIGLNRIDFKIGGGLALYGFGNIKDVRVYNTALTDAELTTLTTI